MLVHDTVASLAITKRWQGVVRLMGADTNVRSIGLCFGFTTARMMKVANVVRVLAL